MTTREPRALYALAVAGLMAGVAAWRWDLVTQAWTVSARAWALGGAARARLAGEAALLAAILYAAWRIIPVGGKPRRDAAILAFGTLFGWLAEAWGTRLGIWRYYTGEAPPLWIVPAWPLGALLISRLAARVRRPAPAGAYWAAAALAAALFASFLWPWRATPAAWAGGAAVAAALALGARPREEFWPLAIGMACVFFADFWGTTNLCWTYHMRNEPWGLWRGIAFGMGFDAAVVIAVLRLTRDY